MKQKQRQALYALAAAVGAVLVAVGVLKEDLLGPVLAVVSGLLLVIGSFTANKHISPDEEEVDPPVAT